MSPGGETNFVTGPKDTITCHVLGETARTAALNHEQRVDLYLDIRRDLAATHQPESIHIQRFPNHPGPMLQTGRYIQGSDQGATQELD